MAQESKKAKESLKGKNLVIVESPAKAKTIEKYLGSNYKVVASMGHIRDLPKTTFGIDVANNFAPQYILISDKSNLVKSLKSDASEADFVYLATDPDREGEAISWHLAKVLGLSLTDSNRVTFNEITRFGVEEGMKSPRSIDIDLVNEQQGRRILDRIVGYKLSPFLWKNIRGGNSLSAGRVQTVAVGLIVDREREISAFQPEEYWSVDVKLYESQETTSFSGKLQTKNGEKIELHSESETNKVLEDLKGEKFSISSIKKSVRKKLPAPPFITSTLQQEASIKLGFQSRRTMRVAQELYEGVDIPGMGAVGLITYMRTDSVRISEEAQKAAAEYIEKKYGKKYLPSSTKNYKSKANAQDAHEAIRPTMPDVSPDDLKGSLSSDQYKLYKLVWDRFIASQMASALYDTVSIDIAAGDYGFKASGYTVQFDGFTVLYPIDDDEKSSIPKHATEGDILKYKDLKGNQHFTVPPSRYTEASLIKALEENGIGRPSTYAPIITTIVSRNYVERDGKSLKPTSLGTIIVDLIRQHFSTISDVAFTAKMEKDLDKVGQGKNDWIDMISKFYNQFMKSLEKAQQTQGSEKVQVPEEETDIICEKCGRHMVIKNGRFGKFLACPGYPECKNTKKIVTETPGECPLCGSKILLKKSKTGKVYYGCEHNPSCNFMSWDEPISEKCPTCGKSLLRKKGKNAKIYCSNPDCNYERIDSKNE